MALPPSNEAGLGFSYRLRVYTYSADASAEYRCVLTCRCVCLHVCVLTNQLVLCYMCTAQCLLLSNCSNVCLTAGCCPVAHIVKDVYPPRSTPYAIPLQCLTPSMSKASRAKLRQVLHSPRWQMTAVVVMGAHRQFSNRGRGRGTPGVEWNGE